MNATADNFDVVDDVSSAYTVAEVAKICRVSDRTALRIVLRLPHLRVGRRRLLPRSVLAEHLASCEEAPA